jgi:biopolymer transport protein ExbB/TolQ
VFKGGVAAIPVYIMHNYSKEHYNHLEMEHTHRKRTAHKLLKQANELKVGKDHRTQ